MINIKTFSVAVLICCSFGSIAQSIGPSTLNAAGGSGTISGNIYEYSIAEISVVSTSSVANIIVTQGVLQPTQNGIGIQDFETAIGGIKVYPNPTQNLVYIAPNAALEFDLAYTLIDISGKTLLTAVLPKSNLPESNYISLEALPAGVYTLLISAKNTDLRTSYKIEKVK